MLSSCKEKNSEYPPRIWSEYSYISEKIPVREISVIYFENEHSIWLGSKGQEGLLHNDGYKWNVFDKANTSIDFDSITSMIRDGNGLLWVGWKNGLASYDGSTWKNTSSLSGMCVTSLAVEGIGNIIVGIKGANGGIAKLIDNQWHFYTQANSDIPSGKINALTSDHNQTIWLASANKGIAQFKNSVWTNISSEMSLLSNEFTCIKTAPDGSVWAASAASQLVHFHNDTFTILNTGASKPITSMFITAEGNIWCGTQGGGLIKFDGTSWSIYNTDNGMIPENDVCCVSEGYAGYLFVGVRSGKILIIKQ